MTRSVLNCVNKENTKLSSVFLNVYVQNTVLYMMHIEEAVFDIPEYLLECEDVKVYNNTYHKKGINNKNEKEILWWDNQQLKWL